MYKNGHNFATGLPIDVMFGSKMGFPPSLDFTGSSNSVLTATCHSYWGLRLFPQPTWRSHPSTDFDAKLLKRRVFSVHARTCLLELKLLLFKTPDSQTFKTAKICSILVGTKCQIFVKLLALNLLMRGLGEI